MPTDNKRRMRYVPERKQQARTEKNYSFYNSKLWRKTSKLYRMDNPLCEVAAFFGEVLEADVVDHLIPINELGAKLDERNLMAMSHKYHNKKSGMEAHKNILIEYETIPGVGRVPTNRENIFKILKGEGGFESLDEELETTPR